MLHGLERVRLEEEFTELPYRSAIARVVPDVDTPDASDPDSREAMDRLMAAFGYLVQLRSGQTAPAVLVTSGMSFEAAVHGVCQSLDIPVVDRLRALEASSLEERLALARLWLGQRLDHALEERGLPRLSVVAGEEN
jgi:hypothetical protein